ncbi:hypothetical protein [Agarivorans sp.]|uniref:hypothetical protein n=1 Tax=Agarivorans sp. TaxID=1872412 RepID=UPI003D041F33
MFEAIQKETFITTQPRAKRYYQPRPLNSAKSLYFSELSQLKHIDEASHFNDRYRPRAN